MKADIDGLRVYFPYEGMYPEQQEYMRELKKALDGKGHCLLEMPTGTGKTVALLSLITSYQLAHPSETRKLLYCTRTVPEMSQTVEELKRVIKYRQQCFAEDNMDDEMMTPLLGVCLSSRRNMCVNEEVLEESDRERVDALCRKKTAPWVRQQQQKHNNDSNRSNDIEDSHHSARLCTYYEKYYSAEGAMPEALKNGVFSLDDMKNIGKQLGLCPYFTTRQLIKFANVVVFNYQYLLDPKVASLVSKELIRESVLVFDEAHNIDNVCIEALSVNFNRRSLEAAGANIRRIERMLESEKEEDKRRLQEEYDKLVQGLRATSNLENMIVTEEGPIADELLEEAVPGNIRKAEHFVQLLQVVVKHLKQRLAVERVEKETPLAFLHNLHSVLGLEARPLRFAYTRLNSLLRTLQVVDIDEFTPLTQVANFLTLVATPEYKEGFLLILEPYDERTPHFIDPILQFACLDASLALKPVLERFQSVIITSGTLSPIELYPKLLGLKSNLIVQRSLSMSIVRPCICPILVTKGSDQTALTTQFSAREDPAVLSNYGALLINLSQCVPDGLVCFFPSYQYLEQAVSTWHDHGVLQRVLKYKLVFLETKDIVETTLALDNYRRACDCGRGAVFLSIARGKVSEGIDFDRHYGRCVVLFGIPFQYTRSHVLLARLEYLRRTLAIREDEFLAFDALRQAAQCVGRVIRNKLDYGLMVFADKRYASSSKRSKLPRWITQFLEEAHTNLSVDEAVAVSKSFLRGIS